MRAGASPDAAGERWSLLRLAVVLVAVHSYCVGLALLLLPEWSTAIGGFVPLPATFFVRQGGVFHLVVATGYLLELRRHGTATLLLLAKATAAVFLLGGWALGWSQAWSVPLSGLGDGLMGLVVWYLARSR